MKFKIKKIPSLNMPIGKRLQRARKRKKLSLEEVEETTKVKKSYLENIERNNFNDLPSDVYTNGFIWRFAEAVGLNPKEIVDLFKQERGLENGTQAEIASGLPPKAVSYPKVMVTPKLLATITAILLFLGFSVYIFTQVSNFAKAPGLEIIKPKPLEFTSQSSGLNIEGKTDPGASVFINDQPIGVDLAGDFSEEVRLADGINEIKVSSKNKAGKKTIKIITASVKLPPIVQKTTANKISGLVLLVEISPNPVWLSVEIDGKTIFQGVMLKGTSQEFRAEREIIVNTGNAGSTHIKLNGKDQGKLGNDGEVKRGIKYTQDMVE